MLCLPIHPVGAVDSLSETVVGRTVRSSPVSGLLCHSVRHETRQRSSPVSYRPAPAGRGRGGDRLRDVSTDCAVPSLQSQPDAGGGRGLTGSELDFYGASSGTIEDLSEGASEITVQSGEVSRQVQVLHACTAMLVKTTLPPVSGAGARLGKKRKTTDASTCSRSDRKRRRKMALTVAIASSSSSDETDIGQN